MSASITSSSTDVSLGLQLHVLTGFEFDNAIYGSWRTKSAPALRPWLKLPQLKYFEERSSLLRSPDTRVFFVLTQAVEGTSDTREAVAMLEIAAEGESPNTVGIKYVSVHEAFRRRGLAMRVYRALVAYLKEQRLRLYRTRAGANTPEGFTSAVTRLLEEERISWYRREH